MIKLKDHPEVAIPQDVSADIRQIVDPVPSKQTSPKSGLSSVPSRCNRVLLPEPLWPMIETKLAPIHIQIDPLEHGHFHTLFAIALVDRRGREDRTDFFAIDDISPWYFQS